MPNYLQNKLTVNCKSVEELENFLSTIKCEDRVIDFNKIIPMPEDLIDTIEGSSTYDNLYYYLKENNKLDEINKIAEGNSLIRYSNVPTDKSKEELVDVLKDGEKIYNRFVKYGFVSWYGWSLYHWGTKWNASETYIIKNRTCATIGFVTAWSAVPMLIDKLVEMFPNVHFEYMYADEDKGCNVGFGQSNDKGEFEFTKVENNSEEALEIYTELWGGDWEDIEEEVEEK